jgi:plasmid replication initiation protein
VTAKATQRPVSGATNRDPSKFLPTSVQKSYFMLSRGERDVLNSALEKYHPGQSEPIFVGGSNLLKSALRLMTSYRLVIEEIKDGRPVKIYTRWIESVEVREAETQKVFLTLSPRFKRIWLGSKKRLLEYIAQNPANIGLRSKYALRLYSWAKRHESVGNKRISVEQIRKVLGLEPAYDAEGNLVPATTLALWANFRQRALDVAIREINKKTDLNIELESVERAQHRFAVLNFVINTQAIPTTSRLNM